MTNTTLFDTKDFDLFTIDGLEDRMNALCSQLRPKFYTFGDDLKEKLSEIAGEKLYPHVAKHARRKTNPPNDSWIAFGLKRGYKMVPHFQICVWKSHVLIQWGIIYEAKNKATFAENLEKHVDEIKRTIPGHYEWSRDHMRPEGIPMEQLSDSELLDFARRLKFNRNGEIMVGLRIDKADALNMSKDAFYQLVLDTCGKLNYLHQLAKQKTAE